MQPPAELPPGLPEEPAAPEPAPAAEAPPQRRLRWQRIFWQGRPVAAFWTVAGIFSLVLNVILVALLLLVARQLFTFKALVSSQLIGGLYENFVLMDQARIVTTIQVQDRIPVQFDLPVKTSTRVRLTRDTRIRDAVVNLTTGGLSISNAPANIVLPAGTVLPIELDIVVPVSATIPVSLVVPVDIPLEKTDLHVPFTGLQGVVAPYRDLLGAAPNSWDETPLCAEWAGWFCDWFLRPAAPAQP
jgi:hypothetical protein